MYDSGGGHTDICPRSRECREKMSKPTSRSDNGGEREGKGMRATGAWDCVQSALESSSGQTVGGRLHGCGHVVSVLKLNVDTCSSIC